MSTLNRAGVSRVVGVAALLAGSVGSAQVSITPIAPPTLPVGATTFREGADGGATPLTRATTNMDTSGDYQRELQACKTGRTAEDRDLCIREAQAARVERKRGGLSNSGAEFGPNAHARCAVQPTAEDKAACEARVLGYGTATGSIEGGGVLYEVETVVLPPGQTEVRVVPKTSGPVVVLPSPSR